MFSHWGGPYGSGCVASCEFYPFFVVGFYSYEVPLIQHGPCSHIEFLLFFGVGP